MEAACYTSAQEVALIVDWLEQAGLTYQVNGGWAVDALAGAQTRAHRDLDVFVDAAAAPRLLAWLGERGYAIVEDWRPIRVELTSATGRVDVHPMVIQRNGDGVQQGPGEQVFVHAAADRVVGTIGGREVVVASAARLRSLRSGYAHREVDLHDLAVLDRLGTGRPHRAAPISSRTRPLAPPP
ncbi:nucleotidyltransferase domain-containing protein [Pseudactinotalea terrae]|uniref:nucleotidyltransferase domain-containing protein n=1 Tax=Pseudactinotalea terrae TaxID=1743262 RepID=UPI0012E1B610|nr:lincomycin resistance protein LmrB [Pseudactinotalea terrae]